MTEECEITGFTHQQQQRWPFVHQYLCDQLELPDGTEIDNETIIQISHDVENVLINQTPSKQIQAMPRTLSPKKARHLARPPQVMLYT